MAIVRQMLRQHQAMRENHNLTSVKDCIGLPSLDDKSGAHFKQQGLCFEHPEASLERNYFTPSKDDQRQKAEQMRQTKAEGQGLLHVRGGENIAT